MKACEGAGDGDGDDGDGDGHGHGHGHGDGDDDGYVDGDNDGDEGRVLATPFQAVAISSRNNLHCNDLSDYSTINAVDAPKEF